MAQFIKDRYGLLIDGQWVDAENGETFVTTNPASGEQLAVCANASPADVDRAVQAARKAFPAWAARSPAERAALLLKIADKIDERAKELAAVETQDNGKPIREIFPELCQRLELDADAWDFSALSSLDFKRQHICQYNEKENTYEKADEDYVSVTDPCHAAWYPEWVRR